MAANPCLNFSRQVLRCMHGQKRRVAGDFVRCMATEVRSSATYVPTSHDILPSSGNNLASEGSSGDFLHPLQHQPPQNPFITPAQCMLYSFPDFEPTQLATYPSTHLLLPLRKDLLHKAVVFEADATRQGTANTKWRGEVHGSGKKIRPQKGSGRARLGDKKSPMLRGGGVAFGPKPRDFSTDLPKKEYDLAWRTALSYRYRRGQLIVLDGKATLESIAPTSRSRYMIDFLKYHDMGHDQRRSLLVTDTEDESLMAAFDDGDTMWEGEYLEADNVDVKDLLELGRIVIEKAALDRILTTHQADLPPRQQLAAWLQSRETQQSPALSISTSV